MDIEFFNLVIEEAEKLQKSDPSINIKLEFIQDSINTGGNCTVWVEVLDRRNISIVHGAVSTTWEDSNILNMFEYFQAMAVKHGSRRIKKK